MVKVVLDASALLASINGEPGFDVVAAVAEGAVVSSVNVAEVATKMTFRGSGAAEIEAALDAHRIVVEQFDRRRAVATGLLAAQTRHRGLSLADRACLALAMELGVPAFTADRAWASLDIGVEIRLIR
jgi:ribonuclease VapC